MPDYTGGQMIVNYLIAEGVSHIFGVAGHGVLGLLDAGYDNPGRIQLVMARHEEVAGFMADGYYRLAHKPAATFTSSGPGSINLLIALAEAMSDSVPFLSLTGNVATSQFNSGALQEMYRQKEADWPSVVRHYVKQTFQVNRVDMLPKVLALGFKTMLNGRQGPVNIDVPYDLFVETADVELFEPEEWTRSVNSRVQGNPEAVAQAVDLLLNSERPLILAGHGVLLAEAWPELQELARELQIPVITSALGKGLMPENDPLALGASGAFGTYLDVGSAIEIGMFPNLPQERFSQVGNAAGIGAREMLVSKSARLQAEKIREKIEYVELTVHSSFFDVYATQLMF